MVIPEPDTRPGLERNEFFLSLLSLQRNHYKGDFKDSGHVACPEGLTRLGALLSDSGDFILDL